MTMALKQKGPKKFKILILVLPKFQSLFSTQNFQEIKHVTSLKN